MNSGRTRIKICGLTSFDDASLAVTLGADAVGFVLWSGSPRAIAAPDVARITKRLPAFVTRVGVFVNASPREIETAVNAARLDVAQLHGDIDFQALATVPIRLVRATSLLSEAEAAEVAAWPDSIMPIVDAHDPKRYGGTGRKADWSRAANLAATRPIVLAGGLNADNVSDAIATVRPHMVDVSSGVEERPGIKDPARLRAFFAAVRVCQEDR